MPGYVTRSRALAPAAQTGVQHVAERIAQHVEGVDAHEDGRRETLSPQKSSLRVTILSGRIGDAIVIDTWFEEDALQQTEALTLADAVFPRIRSDSRAAILAQDLALMIGFAMFTAICAQIAIQTPWSPVPVTMQTFAVLVAGGSLGMWRGAGSMVIYMLMGMFVFSAFAPGDPGVSGDWDVHFILPWSGTREFVWDLASGGYIVGFIVSAALVGFLCERWQWDRKPWAHFGMFLGNAVLYIPGILWLAYDLDISLSKSLEFGLYPFIVGDLMKLGLASLTLPVAWSVVSRYRRKW